MEVIKIVGGGIQPVAGVLRDNNIGCIVRDNTVWNVKTCLNCKRETLFGIKDFRSVAKARASAAYLGNYIWK